MKSSPRRPLYACLAAWHFLALPCSFFAQSSVSGNVPLPDAPPAAVMAKRYEIVSHGGVLSTVPPVAVVWLEGDLPPGAKPSAPAQVSQRNFVFEPSLLAIQTGTTVAFPNFDSEYHNVFSYSPPKRFDLGRYLPDETPVPTQTFEQAGTVVLRCDIHEHMKAIILVVDSPSFMTTDPSGHFELSQIPAGDYVLKAWIDSKTTLEKKIHVEADGSPVVVSFE